MTTEPSSPAGEPLSTPSAVEVVRAEERLRVGTQTRVRERVRVHKRVVTEEVTQSVSVAREVLELESLPVDASDASAALRDDAAGPFELDLVLHEERVVVTKQVVPVERVRVRVHRVTDQVEVAEVLRREEVVAEATDGVRSRSTGT